MRRIGLSVAFGVATVVLLAIWSRPVGAEWATVVSAEMVAQVNGPSTVAEVVLPSGRKGRLEVDFASGTADTGDVLCVEVSESLLGGLRLRLPPNSHCSDS